MSRSAGGRTLRATALAAAGAGSFIAPSPSARAEVAPLSLREPEVGGAPAAAEEPPPRRLDPAWRVQIQPSAWFVAPSGTLRMPISAGSGGGAFTTEGDAVAVERMNLDSTRLMPAGELHINSERWRFALSGAAFGIDREGTVADSSFRLGSVQVDAGDAMDVSFELTTVELTGGYRVWGYDFTAASEPPQNAVDAACRVYALLGARFYDFSFDLTNRDGGASTGADQFFGEPIAGARAEFDIARDFSLTLQLTGGGFADSDRSSFSVDIVSGFEWRPFENVGVRIGYRQLAFDLADGDGAEEFEYDGRLAGLLAGVTIRF